MNERRYQAMLSRAQKLLLPDCLDDYVNEYNPVRAIDAWVATLELKELGFKHTEVTNGGGSRLTIRRCC